MSKELLTAQWIEHIREEFREHREEHKDFRNAISAHILALQSVEKDQKVIKKISWAIAGTVGTILVSAAVYGSIAIVKKLIIFMNI